MTTVQVKGKGVVEFPDNMSPEEISAALKKLEEGMPEKPPLLGAEFKGGANEAILATVSSILAEIVGGVGAAVTAGPEGADTAVKVLEGAREKLTFTPRTKEGEKAVKGIATAAEGITTAVRAPVAGLAAVINPEDPDIASRVLEEGIGGSTAESLFEITGSPLVAAAAETAPTGIAAILTTGVPRKPPVPKGQKISIPKEKPEPKLIPEAKPVAEDVATAIREQRTGQIAKDFAPDIETIEAAKRLGVDLNPEHFSTNAAFQEVARALKAKAGSKLEAAERKALETLAVKADDLTDDLTGGLDKATVSEAIVSDFRTTIGSMEDQADLLYGKVDAAIPKATRVEPNAVRDYLATKIDEFGGDKSLLNSAERLLLKLTESKKGVPNTPTYAALDSVRRVVGDGFNKRTGLFKNDSVGRLRQVYRVLSEDQQSVAEVFGVGELYTSARSVVARRKGIEDQAIQLFGKNLNESLVPKIHLASTSLPKGDVSRFNKLMEALPEARRTEVAAAVLNNLFASGSRRGGTLSQGFASTFVALNRNKAAKDILFRHLPESARKRFDDIGRVFSGIIKANQRPLSNPSGSAAPIVAALEGGNVLKKLYGIGKRAAVAEGVSTSIGVPGAGTAGVVGSVLTKGKTPAVTAADDFLTSPAFRKTIDKSLNGDVPGANAAVVKDPKFRKWVGTLDADTVQRISTLGFIGWLVAEDEEEQ